MRATLIAAGTVMMGYAVLGAVADPDLKPGGAVVFLAAVLVAHDALLMPLTIAAGALLARFAPRPALPGIRAAAIVSLAVGVVALPLVLGFGRTADNPSVLPLAYSRGLLLILALTWSVALASVALTRYRATSTSPAGAPRDADRPSRSDRASRRPEDGNGS